MSQVFSSYGISQELTGLDQMGLGVRQLNGYKEIEARRLVTIVDISYSPTDITVVAARKAL